MDMARDIASPIAAPSFHACQRKVSMDLANWLKAVADGMSLSELTLPRTHDTCVRWFSLTRSRLLEKGEPLKNGAWAGPFFGTLEP
jgi:hypothetical protein